MSTTMFSTITTLRFVSENARQPLEKLLHEIIASTLMLTYKITSLSNLINHMDIAVSTTNVYVPTYTFSLLRFANNTL